MPIEPLPAGLPENLVIETPAGVELESIQTHISFLLLDRDRVYKIRKAVRFSFLSFATRDERNADCLRELHLNRRLAPQVYLGVAPLLERDGHFVVGEVEEELFAGNQDGDVPEHCVVMKRLREGRDAQSLLEDGHLSRDHIDAIADRIGDFHAAHRLGTPAPYSEDGWVSLIESPVIDTFESVIANAPDDELVRLAEELLERIRSAARSRHAIFEMRRREGRAVDGHGDLQLAHIWFDGDDFEPSIIDCTEFNEDFRRIDAASEVAFLAMDLDYRGEPRLAERFLSRYARNVDDFGLYALVDFYAAYRASVRAKVAVLAAIDEKISHAQREAALHSAHAHLRLSEALLEAPRRASITITCGTVGCGKSTVGTAWADETSGVVISSDRTRKHLEGMRADDHRAAASETSEKASGLYSQAHTESVYLALLERAEFVIRSGRDVLLDATFSRVAQRERVRSWAKQRGVPARLLHVVCAPDVARARLAEREREGHDASDAGPSLYDWSVENFELPVEWPAEERVTVATDDPSWRRRLSGEIAASKQRNVK